MIPPLLSILGFGFVHNPSMKLGVHSPTLQTSVLNEVTGQASIRCHFSGIQPRT